MYEQALAQYHQMLELDVGHPSNIYSGIASVYWEMGRYEDVITAKKNEINHWGRPPDYVTEAVTTLDSAWSESGPTGYWMWRLGRMKRLARPNPKFVAAIYAQLGDKDQSFAWLEKAYEAHKGSMYLLKVSPNLDPLRDDPRFDELLRRMNFPG